MYLNSGNELSCWDKIWKCIGTISTDSELKDDNLNIGSITFRH